MTQQKALFLTAFRGSFTVGTKAIPQPGPGEVLIKVLAAALNPAEAIIYAGLPEASHLLLGYPAILGYDIAGTIEGIGEGVSNFQVGDRVMTEPPVGTGAYDYAGFQQYALGKAEVTAKIPPNISFDQAATLPAVIATAAIGFYHSGNLGIPPPWEVGGNRYQNKPILIYGGSSSVGQCAIQFAKLSGFAPIISTASPANSAWLKELGATHVIDRNLPAAEINAEVRRITSEPIEVVYDAISRPETQQLSYELLAPGGPGLLLVRRDQVQSKVSEKRVTLVFGMFHTPENISLGAALYSRLTSMLETGAIKPNRVEGLPNGLEGIVDGLQKLSRGVSSVKLVAHPQETTA